MDPPQKHVAESCHSASNGEASTRVQTPDLEKQHGEESVLVTNLYPETDLDRGIVGWDGQDDPKNPQNFSSGKKWSLLALISAMTLISPLASSMFSPAVIFMAADFKVTNETILSFSVSIYLLGYTVSVPVKSNHQLC
jgi:hypothetical protein